MKTSKTQAPSRLPSPPSGSIYARWGRGIVQFFTKAWVIFACLLSLFILEYLVFECGIKPHLQGYVQAVETLQENELEIAEMKAAQLEAESLAKLIPTTGAATVGLKSPDKSKHFTLTPPASNPSPQSGQSTPALRGRDIDDILQQETDILAEQMAKELAQEQVGQEFEKVKIEIPKAQIELDHLVRTGIEALVEGDMRRCILNFEQAITINPKHPALLYYYGMAYDKLLNPEKAREYYTTLYQMRDAAGKYFHRASSRLTYGFSTPDRMRGKLAFGPPFERLSQQYGEETVELVLPVLLASNEDLLPEDIYIHIQFFDIENGKNIKLSLSAPSLTWENNTPTWEGHEERLLAQYTPAANSNPTSNLGYYGFTAKLYYKGEPMDCVSNPSSLILHEQRLNTNTHYDQEILPDDGLDYSFETALPLSDFL